MDFLQTALTYADDVLAILGGIVVIAVPIVKWTKTDKDDAILAKLQKAVQWLVLHKTDIDKLKKK
jgi:hypothetical protein